MASSTEQIAVSPSQIELLPFITDQALPDHLDNHSDQVLVSTDSNPRTPNGVVVALLMVIGLVGNSLVLYVYHFKMQRTVFSTFVTVLALLDLATVLVGMPIDVLIKTRMLDTSDVFNAICKVAHFEVYSTSLASGSVLLLIAVTRHTKVCRPMQPGLSRQQARVLSLLILAVAMTLCIITFVINGMEKVKVAIGEGQYPAATATARTNITHNCTDTDPLRPNPCDLDLGAQGQGNLTTKVEVVEVYICRISEEKKGTALSKALQAVLMVAFICIFLSLIILHCRISRAVHQFERRQSTLRRVSVHSDAEQQNLTHITGSMFRIFVSITVIFVVSYLPHLVCLIVEKSLFRAGDAMPKTARVLMDLAYNTPYINVVANPFIYGYRSHAFRRHCSELMYSCCRRCCYCFCWCRGRCHR